MSFVISARNPFTFEWTLVDSDSSPVLDAEVTATLYAGRSPQIPDTVPGEPVEGFDDVTLELVPDSAGVYQVDIAGTFNPELGGDYILVVDAMRTGQVLGHWEINTIVAERAA